jgi:hypothetical protein
MQELYLKNKKINIFIYIFIVSTILIFYSYSFPSSNNLIEVPPILAMLDPELYKNDFFVRDMLKITPRYYYQYLIYFATKLGISLVWTYFLCYVLSFASLMMGLYSLGKKNGGSNLSGVILPFLALFSIDATVGYVSIFRSEPIPAIFAMGLTIWGIYFCFCQRWTIGYLFFGLACILQFLVGLLPGLLLIPSLFIDAKRNFNFRGLIWSLFIFAAFIGLVYIPMVVTSDAGNKLMSSQDFVYVYGYIRHPHHIIPSSFPEKHWRNFVFFILGGIVCIFKTKSLKSETRLNLVLVVVSSLLALLFSYIFVEIYPSSLFAKLQLARTTPFAELSILIAVSVLIQEQYYLGNIAISLLLLVTPIVNNGAVVFWLVAVSLYFVENKKYFAIIRSRLIVSLAIVLAILLIAFNPPTTSLIDICNRIIWKLVPLLIISLPFLLEEFFTYSYKLPTTIYALPFISLTVLSFGLTNILPKNISSFIQNQIAINLVNQDPITQIALKFRNLSDKNALILIPPSLTKFRFYSQRSVVFDFRSFPYTDRGIMEWKKRLIAIAGEDFYLKHSQNLDDFYRDLNEQELLNLAKQFNANYILTRSDWHSQLDRSVVVREREWVIYKIGVRD